MKKFYFHILAVTALFCISFGAKATGWPANYRGVMLQGFYWDSYNDSKWTNLTSQSDELSKYFSLIWVPNSAKSSGNPTMGYMPIYWFTNHNSSFGTEAQLKTMIKTFKEKGVGIIEDVVVNHRVGVSNWADFPTETWNGQTWKIGPEGICRTDEWGQGTGAADTGDDFNGARDLDHTNANVQNNVKNYCKFLIDDLGYVGFRLDMVKGYGGQYTKIYNQYAKPQFSVGEYWDGNYDAVAAWIEATGKESAAFDFPFKYQVNEAFASNDMRKLCWTNPSGAYQPAGLIHYGYAQYAVTFVDNHDTYRDGSKFNGNVLAANAFMLCSPGTPCVFYKHYLDNKTAIQALVKVRNDVGVHNMSAVNVLKLTNNCYMAEVTGMYGKLVVRIGSTSDTPSGYSASDIKAQGNGYCVWATTGGGQIPSNEAFTVYFKNTKNWTNPYIHYWGDTESTWPGVKMEKYKDNVWKYTVPAGTTGCLFNAGDGDATKTADMSAQANHLYTPDGDQGVYSDADPVDPVPGGNYPATLYLLGNVNGTNWSTTAEFPAKGANGVYNWDSVEIDDAGSGAGYFTFVTATGSNWDAVNASDRYGASSHDEMIAEGKSAPIILFNGGGNASGANSWMITPGLYKLSVDLTKGRLSVLKSTALDLIGADAEMPVEYYNLQGVKVANPQSGIYIRVQGKKVEKIVVQPTR